jgi:hypothetical protein
MFWYHSVEKTKFLELTSTSTSMVARLKFLANDSYKADD